MSDDEAAGGLNSLGDDSDLALPKATIAKYVSECLPEKMACAKDARDLISTCCNEFINSISSEAQEICDKDSKKTMSPEHVVEALSTLGFEKYVEQVQSTISDNKTVNKERVKRTHKMKTNTSGLSEAELLAQQEQLFAASRARAEGIPEASAPAPAPQAAAADVPAPSDGDSAVEKQESDS